MSAVPTSLHDLVQRLRTEGLGYKRIAKMLNRNIRTIKRTANGDSRYSNKATTRWTDDLVSLLKVLHAKGVTYEQMVGLPEFASVGLSVCAIKNKAHRLKLPRRNDNSAWEPGQIEALKSLWDEGYSASLVAERLGGVSKSAVIAKARRLGFPQRETTIFKKPHHARGPRKTPVKRTKSPPESSRIHQHEDIARVSLLDLGRDQCRWPVGHVGQKGFGFCGNGIHPGSPYCSGHTLRAYNIPPSERSFLKHSARTGGFA